MLWRRPAAKRARVSCSRNVSVLSGPQTYVGIRRFLVLVERFRRRAVQTVSGKSEEGKRPKFEFRLWKFYNSTYEILQNGFMPVVSCVRPYTQPASEVNVYIDRILYLNVYWACK